MVTYPNDEEEGFEELKYFSEIIQGNRKEKEFSDNEEILVIFGYENDFQWEGYISVSYTHLDVYKRQLLWSILFVQH